MSHCRLNILEKEPLHVEILGSKEYSKNCICIANRPVKGVQGGSVTRTFGHGAEDSLSKEHIKGRDTVTGFQIGS
jgi:hypothetical protein